MVHDFLPKNETNPNTLILKWICLVYFIPCKNLIALVINDSCYEYCMHFGSELDFCSIVFTKYALINA